MVQTYLRHGPTQAFGVVCSASSISAYDGKLAYVPALEDVLVWDVKKGEMLAMWHETGHRAEVTVIIPSPQKDVYAVGYVDGSIRLWKSSTASVIATFNGHKKAVTVLAFDEQGTRLASGSQDTDLILWDVVGEAGLFRLRGHRDQITAIQFIHPSPDLPSTSTSKSSFLLTTSKDTFLKLWDLSTQHCVQTIVAHRADVWSMAVDQDQSLVFTGSGEGELKAWSVDHDALARGLTETATGEVEKMIHPIGNLPLSSSHRVSQITFHASQPYLAVQSHDRSVEVFRIRTEDEVQKKRARRKKREKEKAKKKDEDMDVDAIDNDAEIKLVDLFTPHAVVRASGKVRSFAFAPDAGSKASLQLFTALSSNALEVYSIPTSAKPKEGTTDVARLFSVDLPGHRTDIRTLCLSADDRILASASNGSLKLWNMKTNACIRTMECSFAICCTFLPGDRQIAVGTKSGEILLYDLASASLIETVKAHTGAVWSLHVRPDGQALVSGSADKEVHIRTLKMTDDVLSVRYSPNGTLLAVALLDSTVKVFYQDTLKFFLSLYGHKLPVLSMDISDDSKLIVTCSADKNVKIWGLDFGDCHKSIFAHDESVMQVAFEKDSHYFWTVGKDKMLKYWDGDKFENIQKLDGHHGEVWALALSHEGKFVVTGSHDKSIRVWEKLDEPLFLEEERERELEHLYESGVADTLNRTGANEDQEDQPEVSAVSKQTTETLMAGERIMEALELADTERAAFRDYSEATSRMAEDDAMRLQPPPRNPVLAAYDMEPEAYVLHVIEKIATTALQDALLVLPFTQVISLMGYLNIWAQNDWNIVLVSRLIFFLLKTHHHQIVSNRVMRTSLLPLRKHLRNALQRQKDIIGYNMAALHYISRRNEQDRSAQFYEDGLDEEQVRAKIAEGKKRKRVSLKA
ncbi:hypothetical protein C8J56DRAFT_1136000 [Mycena floridula]|nr:hypothetical protein C8J56DRAFT_1136000 [Mycena floridula]